MPHPVFIANDNDLGKLLDTLLRETIVQNIAEVTIEHLNDSA